MGLVDCISKVTCCSATTDVSLNPKDVDDMAANNKAWNSVYTVFNCVLFMLFVIIYVIGMIYYCV